jgi:hypothetical protein
VFSLCATAVLSEVALRALSHCAAFASAGARERRSARGPARLASRAGLAALRLPLPTRPGTTTIRSRPAHAAAARRRDRRFVQHRSGAPRAALHDAG